MLKVISRSTFDLQVVLDTLVESAARLCEAEKAFIYRSDDEVLRMAATYNVSESHREFVEHNPVRPGRHMVAARVALELRAVHIENVHTDFEYAYGFAPHGSLLGVPMLRGGELLGVIVLIMGEVRPFTDKQIELVTTFADQAVIAIENVRLFEAEQQRTRELTKLLEQQTATAKVLQVISSSPGDLQPVFAAMLENAVRICSASFGNIYQWDGNLLHLGAEYNAPHAFTEARGHLPLRPSAQSPAGRMVASRTVIHVTDLAAERVYTDEHDPQIVAAVELADVRTVLAVPIVREGELIGGFLLARHEVRPFTDKQIELVQNFANQAVIAIAKHAATQRIT